METQDKQKVFIGCNITEEQSNRNYEHYKEIKDQVEIINYYSDYGKKVYKVKPLNEELTVDEIALACGKGYLFFGYDFTKYDNNIIQIEVYTD